MAATDATRAPILEVRGLNVFYGRAHALQDVSLTLSRGVLSVVGRNGMGKTSLCNAITGLIPASGSVRLMGEEILGLTPDKITDRGIGYVPQGRRVWASLSVDEHLRLSAKSARQGAWTIARIYQTFPRLAERKGHGGAQLSGGEQQMLAIARALLFNPLLLVMDEPTEGLAPVIVDQLSGMLATLAREGEVSVLLIEQNLGVALDAADTVAVMVNGRLARIMPAAELKGDTTLQQRLLGVRSAIEEDEPLPARSTPDPVTVYTIKRAGDSEIPPFVLETISATPRTGRTFTAWADAQGAEIGHADADADANADRVPPVEEAVPTAGLSVAATFGSAAYVCGTFDTKGRELLFIRNCLDRMGVRCITVDLSTSGKPSTAKVSAADVARHHPRGERAVFTGDRGSSVTEMATAFENFIVTRRDLGGIISAGGSGGTALATPGMRRLPIGTPKLMVSTMASGNVRPYVGAVDICMMYAVTDISGINRISERVLANAAHALGGMIVNAQRVSAGSTSKPALGLTMFGLTTPCVQAVSKALEDKFDCLTFHATGTGGQSMEKLVESGLLSAVIDITTTEIADEIVGGVLSAGPQRMDAIIGTRIPYVVSLGALDMVNFHALDTVPAQFRSRNLYQHNPNVTLLRTTAQENVAIAEFIAGKLNRMEGPVRLLIPSGGLSGLDAPGQPFWDPEADEALFATLEAKFRRGADRKLLKLPHHINDPQFAQALVARLHEITGEGTLANVTSR